MRFQRGQFYKAYIESLKAEYEQSSELRVRFTVFGKNMQNG